MIGANPVVLDVPQLPTAPLVVLFEVPGWDGAWATSEAHCTSCWQMFVCVHPAEGDAPLRCPYPGCGGAGRWRTRTRHREGDAPA